MDYDTLLKSPAEALIWKCAIRDAMRRFNECAYYSAPMDKTNILKGVVGLLQTSSLHCKWSGLGKWRLHCLVVQLSLQSNNWAFSMQLWFLSPGTQGKEETGHSKWQSLSLNNMQLFTCHARRTNAGLPWKPRNILCKTMEMPMHSAFIQDYTQTVGLCSEYSDSTIGSGSNPFANNCSKYKKVVSFWQKCVVTAGHRDWL